MKRTNLDGTLGKTFNANVAIFESRLRDFLNSGDPANTQALRRALRRLRTAYSILPKKPREEMRFRLYLKELGRLSKASGHVRDLDTISARAAEVTDARDWRAAASEIARLRAASLRNAMSSGKLVEKLKVPHVKANQLGEARMERRFAKRQDRLVRRVDKEFEEFLSTQEVEVMHALRKDAKRLRHLLELTGRNGNGQLLKQLRSIQDELGAIRDHDLVIDYLRGRVNLTSTRPLVREEIARRHAGLEDFITKYRGQGRLVAPALKVRK
jgi:CHAD domain-containing protein